MLSEMERRQAVPFAPAASRWRAEKRLITGLRLPDRRWALGSILGGVLARQCCIEGGLALREDLH